MTELNLIETIAREPKFSYFSRYMSMSKADAVFSRPGGFTVFVPTDEAFAKVPDDQMNQMLAEPGLAKLKALVSYHILPGRIMAANIGAKQVRNSVSGEEVDFADFRGITVNGEPLQMRNIEASNGVIHSLGTVLCPVPLAGDKPLGSAVGAKPDPENTNDGCVTAEFSSAASHPRSGVDPANAANSSYADAAKLTY